jgi:hypothetical protein
MCVPVIAYCGVVTLQNVVAILAPAMGRWRTGMVIASGEARLLTQKVHSAPITQQAGKLASHAQRANDVPVNFS